MSVIPFIGPVATLIERLIDRAIPDENERERIKAQIAPALIAERTALAQAKADIIKAEAQSKWAIAATARPFIVYVFGLAILNDMILSTWIHAAFGADVRIGLDAGFWGAFTVVVGGYGIGRTWEKSKGVT
ncbi:MAG: 3TM-type holin [Pseudomonadota bacterium]